jgi:hypothetical protein
MQVPPDRPVGKPAGGEQTQLLNAEPGVIQVQILVPAPSMPQVTQQSCEQGVVQFELSHVEVQAPVPTASGFAFVQSS